MLPLDEFVERDSFGGDYIPTIWQPGPSGYFDGKRIGIPYSADAYGIVYRKDIFEEAGLTADWETWDDYIETLDKLAMHLEGSDIAPSVFSWGAAEQTPSIFLGMYDGYLVDSMGNYSVEEESAVAALEKMASLLAYNPEGAAGLSIDESNSVFLTGKAATMICWVSFMRASAQDPDSSLGRGQLGGCSLPGTGLPLPFRMELVHLGIQRESWRRLGVGQGLHQCRASHNEVCRIGCWFALFEHLRRSGLGGQIQP